MKKNPSQLELFLSISSRVDLARFLGIEEQLLRFLLYRLTHEERYRTFTIKKRGGGYRTIRAPIKPLKELQKKLSNVLYDLYEPRVAVHGYSKGKGILTNATVHQKQHWVFKADLKDFFPSINFGRVRGLFLAKPFSFPPDVATVIAQLCVYSGQNPRGELPQGAPTSPIISNLICRRLDKNLASLAKKYRCYYSRYADDIVFSTNKRGFPKAMGYISKEDGTFTGKVGKELLQIIQSNGFSVNSSKVSLRGGNTRQQVTGLVVNEKPNVTREYVRNIRAMLYSWEKYGLESAGRYFFDHCDKKNRPPGKPAPSFARVVRGRIQFVGSIKGWDDPVYLKFAHRLSKLDPGFEFDIKRAYAEIENKILVFAEGKTDYKHLKAALAHFRKNGQYSNLEICFHDPDKANGDDKLFTMCKLYSETEHSDPCIFIFDRDKPSRVKDVSELTEPYKVWGNNVFSFAIPVPDHRNEERAKVCIEMYYKDDDLKRKDESGRRIFLRSEFDETNGSHHSENIYCIHPKNQSIVADTDVFDKTSGENVALSKNTFADYILEAEPPFDNVDFEPFKEIFDVIVNIQRQI